MPRVDLIVIGLAEYLLRHGLNFLLPRNLIRGAADTSGKERIPCEYAVLNDQSQ